MEKPCDLGFFLVLPRSLGLNRAFKSSVKGRDQGKQESKGKGKRLWAEFWLQYIL